MVVGGSPPARVGRRWATEEKRETEWFLAFLYGFMGEFLLAQNLHSSRSSNSGTLWDYLLISLIYPAQRINLKPNHPSNTLKLSTTLHST